MPGQSDPELDVAARLSMNRQGPPPNALNGGRILGCLPADVNCTSLSIQGISPLSKPIATLLSSYGKQGGLGDKFFQAIMNIPDELRQKMASAGVTQSSVGDIVGHGHNLGGGSGGFVANVTSAVAGAFNELLQR